MKFSGVDLYYSIAGRFLAALSDGMDLGVYAEGIFPENKKSPVLGDQHR